MLPEYANKKIICARRRTNYFQCVSKISIFKKNYLLVSCELQIMTRQQMWVNRQNIVQNAEIQIRVSESGTFSDA